MEIVDISGLDDLPVFTLAHRDRPSISESTRIIGNYAFFPGLGWRRYWTLDDATWNQYLY